MAFRNEQHLNPQLNPTWLAGYLECNGSLMLASSGHRKLPTISFKGTPQTIEKLRALFLTPESLRKPRSDSRSPRTIFRIAGDTAHEILSKIDPAKTPARRTEIEGLQEENAEKISEGRRIRRLTLSPTMPNPYETLLEDPEYAGGVIDAIAGISLYNSAQDRHLVPFVSVYSSNAPLLAALHKKFGGAYVAPTDTQPGKFMVTHQKARALYNEVAPFLQIKKPRADYVFLQEHKKPREEEQQQEAFAQANAEYLAGFLTLTGSIYGKRVVNNGGHGVIPRIRLHGNLQILEKWGEFMHVFHPRIKPIQGKQSYTSVIQGEAARKIMHAIVPLMQTRREILTYFVDQWNSISRRDRSASYPAPTPDTQINLDQKRYAQLLKKPAFVAGLLDAGKTFRLAQTSSSQRTRNAILFRYPSTGITTNNEALVYALQSEFGGDVYPIPHTNSFTWSIKSVAERSRLYQIVKPYLVVHKEQADEIMCWFDEPHITSHIGTILAKTMKPQTSAELIAQLIQRVGQTDALLSPSVAEKSALYYVEQLVAQGQVLKEGDTYRMVVAHPDNYQFVEHSPLAMKELLMQAVQTDLLITALGKLLAIRRQNTTSWYEPTSRSRDSEIRLENASQSFVQFAQGGRIINVIRKIGSVGNTKVLAAIEETFQHALERASELYFADLETIGDDIGIENVTSFSPIDEAKQLMSYARSLR